MRMVWYHGTSKAAWEEAQREGYLWGVRGAPSRCTYLASTKTEAALYGEIVLRVKWTPNQAKDKDHNYVKGCWQVRVYSPIPLTDVRKIN